MAKLNVNGRMRNVQAEADTPLLWVIREQVGLTGTKYGCGVAQCGACSVHINGEVRRSCSIPVGSIKAGDRIVTIEGLSANSSHPVQKAWAALDVPQCGYCQSGQIMAGPAAGWHSDFSFRSSNPPRHRASPAPIPRSTHGW